VQTASESGLRKRAGAQKGEAYDMRATPSEKYRLAEMPRTEDAKVTAETRRAIASFFGEPYCVTEEPGFSFGLFPAC
jgi:hypothetical protein